MYRYCFLFHFFYTTTHNTPIPGQGSLDEKRREPKDHGQYQVVLHTTMIMKVIMIDSTVPQYLVWDTPYSQVKSRDESVVRRILVAESASHGVIR